MKDHEREIMFTAEQVGNLVKFFPNHQRHETYTREETETELILRYEFNSLSSDGSLPFLLVEELRIDRNGKQVAFPNEMESEKARFNGLLIGMEEEELKDLFTFGSKSAMTVLLHEGNPVGSSFRMENGNYSVNFLLCGYAFKSKENWDTIFLPYLKYLDKEVGGKKATVMLRD